MMVSPMVVVPVVDDDAVVVDNGVVDVMCGKADECGG